MENIKFELIIAYYKRPDIVKNALDSIMNLNYNNWHLTFIDDSGDENFKETFFNYGFDEPKIEYIPILMSDNYKSIIGGSMFGKYINDVIKKSDADVVMLICDDDALVSDYLNNLNDFYVANPDKNWCYCHVKLYNPEIEKYTAADDRSTNYDWSLNFANLNAYTHPILPSCRVDSSQVTFRRLGLIKNDVWYAYPKTRDLDADIFTKMGNTDGECHFCGCFGQYKGWFSNQLGVRFRSGNGNYF